MSARHARLPVRPLTTSAEAHGFTLIEMLIAMLLLSMLIAAILPLTSNLLHTGNAATSGAEADGDSVTAAHLLQSDIRAMLAPGPGDGRSTSDRSDAANTISDLSSTAASEHDIEFAGPRALVFWANVLGTDQTGDPAPGQELVQWFALQNNKVCGNPYPKADWCLVRSVGYGPSVNKTNWVREVVAHGPGTLPTDTSCYQGASQVQRVFCYKYEAPIDSGNNFASNNAYSWAGWTTNCTDAWKAPAGNDWNNGSGPSSISAYGTTFRGVAYTTKRIRTYHQRAIGGIAATYLYSADRITSVGIVAPGGGNVGGAGASTATVQEVDIPSRSSYEYQAAIMCGER